MSTEVMPIEIVDLSDLDLLDDANAHARCTYCYPGDMTMTVIVALCGAEAIQRTGIRGWVPPPDACEACKAAWDEPCRRCGR